MNHSFIFGFKRGTGLGYNEVLLLGFGLAVFALGSVLANLDMQIDPETKDYKTLTELIPLILLLVRNSCLKDFSIKYFRQNCIFSAYARSLYFYIDEFDPQT